MSSQLSSINGVMSSSTTYAFRLQPTGAGTFRIPMLSLDWNGQSLSTDGIDITVTQGTGAAAQPAPQTSSPAEPATGKVSRVGDNDFFIETSIDKKTPYQGEAVKHVTRLYSSMMLLGQPDYQAPQFIGFWHADEPEVQQSQATASDGTTYDVTEITTWLFPTAAGQATLDPVKITVPGGFFSADVDLQSEPLSIEVQPLPAGAPADFNGAVGQFQTQRHTRSHQHATRRTDHAARRIARHRQLGHAGRSPLAERQAVARLQQQNRFAKQSGER